MAEKLRILITGASGFLGKIIVDVLAKEHHIVTLGRKAENQIHCDVSTDVPELPEIDIVLHAAGKAHSIPKTEAEKQTFFNVNARGTQHVLRGIVQPKPPTLVLISSVAVYGLDCGINIPETHPLQGNTPYAQSKIEAETLCLEWAKNYNANTVILRLPLISGANPPGNLAAMAKAIKAGYYFRIGTGAAQKSVVAAADVARLIPTLHNKSGIYNLTDGVHPSLMQIENHLGAVFHKRIKALPETPLRLAAKLGDLFSFLPLNSLRLQKLTGTLTFDDALARKELHWAPQNALTQLSFSE